MSGAHQQQNSSVPIRDEFISLLESQWTRQVACQNECGPDEVCSCQRKIVHVHAMEEWWKKPASESPGRTNLEHFVDDMPIPPRLNLPFKATKISGSGQSYLRILSLLVRQRRDHLINCFYEANMYDHYIDHSENDKKLREQLAGVVSQKEVEDIISDFHKEKWEYCPLSLALDMGSNLHGSRVIPPFCSKIRLPDKGGTASIYWVAVQKDLVTDNALAYALKDSLYTDGIYGECYQMVLKSYCGNKKRDFEMEKEAFSGLQSTEEAPILQYLGSYTHDYGEGSQRGRTYNLLLEYGENDLYQAWADETNVPPVQAQEILQSWNSLFKVAGAIRQLHNLEFPRGQGQPWRFHGWHADIKPDNILSVRGRLKLADFGFSSFAPVLEGHGGSEPTDIIRGFTDTYGAPEVSRMKQPDGTLSGVSQSIDAWSFGCVLSVAATWIVLGFQGIRQYERLRQLSPANRKDGITSDRFHDGFCVLPEVEKWHDYLRGHLRPSDTTTEQVLSLVEGKLLRSDPAARYSVEELCEKLHEVSAWAEYKIKDLKKHSKEPHHLVMKALSNIEEEAQTQRSSEPKTNLLQQPLLQVNPRERASMQINKEELIKNKPLGQTAHRKQILEKKLEGCHVMKMDVGPLANSIFNGAVTHSPTDSTPPNGLLDFTGRKTKLRNPLLQGFNHTQSDLDPRTPNSTRPRATDNLPETPPPSGRRNGTSGAKLDLASHDHLATNVYGPSFEVGSPTSTNSDRLKLRIPTRGSPSAKYIATPAQSNGTRDLPSSSEDEGHTAHNTSLSSSNTYKTVEAAYSAESPPHTLSQAAIGLEVGNQGLPLSDCSKDRQGHEGKRSVISDTRPMGSPFMEKRVIERLVGNSEVSSQDQNIGSPGLSITVSNPDGGKSLYDQQAIPHPGAYIHEMQAAQDEHTFASPKPSDSIQLPLPLLASDLPFDICIRRKEMDGQVSKGLAKGFTRVKGSFGIETRARDASLAEPFSNRRELIFVVDNGSTMSAHWPIVAFVAQTLAKKAAGLDKSGFDLKFTVDGHKHDEKNLKGDPGRTTLKKALNAAWPERYANSNATSDMARVFATIFQEWNCTNRPATTLLVLTDGVWPKTNLENLNKIILDIAGKDDLSTGNRHFSIQFIRFGDEAPEKARLQWLDDHLCVDCGLRDIIDHCSWRAKVDKMFKGSIKGYADNQNSDEKPMSYDYEKLVDLFNTFNKEDDATLSPTGLLSRTPSRGSNRSSISMHHFRTRSDTNTR